MLEQINSYEEGPGGKRLYAYLVQVAILPNETGKPELHVAIETHHCTRSIQNETDEGEPLTQQYALSHIPVELADNYNSRNAVGCKGYKVSGLPIK